MQPNHLARRGSLLILVSWLSARLRWSLLEFSALSLPRLQPKAIESRINHRQQRLVNCIWFFEKEALHWVPLPTAVSEELVVYRAPELGRN
ncbi:hypothetical protein MJD09_16860 [bacterium]|nr:hypothetical protein [bacterium]